MGIVKNHVVRFLKSLEKRKGLKKSLKRKREIENEVV